MKLQPGQIAVDKTALRIIIGALSVPRNRFGKLEVVHDTWHEALTDLARAVKIPHGGLDVVDKAVMVLQRLSGEEPKSILD